MARSQSADGETTLNASRGLLSTPGLVDFSEGVAK